MIARMEWKKGESWLFVESCARFIRLIFFLSNSLHYKVVYNKKDTCLRLDLVISPAAFAGMFILHF